MSPSPHGHVHAETPARTYGAHAIASSFIS
jgi:hypothetical protein